MSDEKKKSILQMDVKDLFKVNMSGKKAFIFICILALLGGYGYFILYPRFIEVKSNINNVEMAQNELSNYNEKILKLPELNDELEALNRKANLKSKVLSYDMQDGLFLIGLDKFSGAKIKSYTLGESIDYEDFYAIPMTLRVEGSYRQVKDLIYYIEEQKNVTRVLDYSMETKYTESKTEAQKRVYWSENDTVYHLDKECPEMAPGNTVYYGTKSQSGVTKPDPVCVGDVSNTVDVQVTTRATGEVYADIKFVVYSSDESIFKLDTDNPANWTPGKYSPFEDTLN